MGSVGCLVQAVMPASAMDAPISFRNPRRETASSHSDAPLGNSRCIISWNSVVPASSSRLRQNSGPFFFSMSARTCTRSSLPFLPGQTSSRCGFCSSLFMSDHFGSRHFRAGHSHSAPSRLEPLRCNLPCHPNSRQPKSQELSYRWHVEQLVISITERTLYFCTRYLPRSIWCVNGFPSTTTGKSLVG